MSSTATSIKVDARRRALLAGGIGNFLEWYDFALYGFFATTLAAIFFPEGDDTAALLYTFAIFGASFLARPLGAIVFGHISDRYGRKVSLLITVVLMSISTVGIGSLPTYTQVGTLAALLLLVCRLVQGFSAGGEFAGSSALVIEHTEYKRRGRYAGYASVSFVIGTASAALISMIITATTSTEQLESWVWRVPFLLAAPLSLLALYLRLRVEESPEFTNLRAEGKTEAIPLLKAFKTAKRPMVIVFVWCSANGVAYFLMSTFLVSHLTTVVHMTRAQALGVQVIAQLVLMVGCFTSGHLIDRIGRKKVAVGAAAGMALWAIPSYVLLDYASLFIVCLATALFALLYSGITTTNTLAIVELFPPNVRTSGAALSYQLGLAVFGGSAPYLATLFTERGFELFPGLYLAVLFVIATFIALYGIGNSRKENDSADGGVSATGGSPSNEFEITAP